MGTLDAIERLWGLSVTALALSYVLGAALNRIAGTRHRGTSGHGAPPGGSPEGRAAKLARRWWGWQIDGGSRR